ncbi:MAG: methyltransferase domain-containing protein [Gammaproteobacteria bacterium]
MAAQLPLAELLACPACGSGLTGMACLACRMDFPTLAGIPWLMPDPRAALIEWRGRLHHLLTHYASEAARHRAALAEAPPGSLTRVRLERVAAAFDDQVLRVRGLMQPLGLERRNEAHAVHVALGTELPLTQGLTSYYANLHRDWCWGEAENAASLAAVVGALPAGSRPARVLVPGAGASRLACDLHARLAPELTVALDFNPLFILAAARITAGTALELYEFPIAPKNIAEHAVLRRLAAPAAPPPGLAFVLGDATAPPFRPGSFDLVLTPWLIDILAEPMSRQLRRINALLAPGGSWVNHGSLAFTGADPAEALSLEELLEMLPAAGFARAAARESQMPYLASPASRHAREETIITFCARKERDVPAPSRGRELPEWLRRSDLPVPQLPQFRAQALSSRVYAFLLAMIDGERTVHDMARLMEQQQLMKAEDAEPSIRRFLLRALEQSGARPSF